MGPVLFSLKDLKSLKWLSLGQNQLGMGSANDLSFLTSLSNSSHLEGLSLHDNSFGGAFPNCIINLTAGLRYVYMGRNQLTGSIPSGIENLANLILLAMESNFLTGTIPFNIAECSKLQALNLNNNRLVGEIPTLIGNITLLNELHLSNNSLWGRIPESLGKCWHLSALDLFGIT